MSRVSFAEVVFGSLFRSDFVVMGNTDGMQIDEFDILFLSNGLSRLLESG